MADKELRSAVFSSFLCSPAQLERIVGRILGCAVRFNGILGMGGWNLVLDAQLHQSQQGKREERVAIRLPLGGESRIRSPVADSGYAATLFLAGLGIPTVVAGPIRVASPPLPYTPRGKSHLTVMPVAEGVPAWELWRKGATVEWKKTVLADLADVTIRLYQRPLDSMGGMAVGASDGAGAVHLGPVPQSPVSEAMERGMDVGALSPGPYSSWKEYARNHTGGLVLLYGNSRRYGESIRANAAILLRWLDEFQESSGRFFLHHPDFGPRQVLVDPASGHVQCILDWDGARTGTVQSLAACFFLPFSYYREEDEEEAEELFGFFKQQLIRGGAPEFAGHARRHWSHESCDPQVLFEEEMEMGTWDVQAVQLCVERLCGKLQKLGIVGGEEEVACMTPPWSRRPSSCSSSDEGERSPSSCSSSGEAESSDGKAATVSSVSSDERTGSSCSGSSTDFDLDSDAESSPSASSAWSKESKIARLKPRLTLCNAWLIEALLNFHKSGPRFQSFLEFQPCPCVEESQLWNVEFWQTVRVREYIPGEEAQLLGKDENQIPAKGSDNSSNREKSNCRPSSN
ncbi:hypothetical protein SELMODRAFT_426616 [Selaginella moellendorffii]|uniref:Uncharacterized protein n=1 Tax=Selaginella moellendorffii TaxID=88036 RepID=D8SWY4_SELML|nr:hypothetical protein SELMODRAFT_426616 [Selaginella moellendorffii]